MICIYVYISSDFAFETEIDLLWLQIRKHEKDKIIEVSQIREFQDI
jgi:hypothetical protein